jgi:hypothetical protein
MGGCEMKLRIKKDWNRYVVQKRWLGILWVNVFESNDHWSGDFAAAEEASAALSRYIELTKNDGTVIREIEIK